ncbi:UNVERIFIED_CONTAM: Retrovirus-related Pol polyprotein from type-2 retrotransposable element R2DM [Sesamum latifolium]|uniref:Retrovirus-related Pol polyprotein from type-2 retrotransposable element R2DM n=1 Tax=Sesamum latifolium TaxID=2727402 RepID=A0AAW2RUG5_9LAMI
MFRFDNYLTLSSEFIPSVQCIWQDHIMGTAMFVVTRKLRALKPVFRAQRQKRGDLSNNVKLAADSSTTCYIRGLRLHDEGWDQCSRIFFRKEEARSLLVPVTSDEIKQAVFDIDETKAPGPNGYSSGFFKAAWPIVGREVTRAIMDFFVTGRLLKQVNSTLISLIPKISNPTVVAEFRPMSCCNVLYKVITKILVQGMRGILDSLISPSQNAFVPGRSIGDNILLAQELFYGYHQQHLPPRCALKVDLRKAYDTVEWDFLHAVLILFGFPEQFIGWIVECVTTPSFSVCLNGSPHGYFTGARGLRQGDPMSPAMQLCQLGFADDLLLFSKADTSSVHVFKRALTVFADLSGLQANLHKSHLILSRSAAPLRDTLLAILDFQEGHLPLRYLGLPLLASRLSVADCQPILQKIDGRIRGWYGIMLSFAGRVQLIQSVLSALQGSTDVGYAKVAWQQVCRPASEGGLGIHDLQALNKGLMSQHLWRVITADRSSIWVDWIFIIGFGISLFGWIGDGTSFSLWHDPWHTLGSLILQFPLGPRHNSIPDFALLCMVLMGGDWSWPPITNMESIGITHSLPPIHGGNDCIQWSGPGGTFSSAAAYDVFCPPGPKVGWSSLLEGTFKIPRHRFILWMLFQKLISTCSLPVLMRQHVCKQYGGRFLFVALTPIGRHWSSIGHRSDGGESILSTLRSKRYWLH